MNVLDVYEKGIDKALIENLSRVREEIDSPAMKIKIQNEAIKWNDDIVSIRQEILDNERYARGFIKDPKKQNIYENIWLDYVNNKGYSIKKIPAGGRNAYYLENGELLRGSSNPSSTKTMDFIDEENDIFYYNKYIKDRGGAQDNQYNDVVHFLKEANKYMELHSDGRVFVAAVDGDYFKDKFDEMNSYCSKNVKVMEINDF